MLLKSVTWRKIITTDQRQHAKRNVLFYHAVEINREKKVFMKHFDSDFLKKLSILRTAGFGGFVLLCERGRDIEGKTRIMPKGFLVMHIFVTSLG